MPSRVQGYCLRSYSLCYAKQFFVDVKIQIFGTTDQSPENETGSNASTYHHMECVVASFAASMCKMSQTFVHA